MTYHEPPHSEDEHLSASLVPEDVLEMMAHELKHPTNSIIGWTHVPTMDGTSIEEKSQAIDRIQVCAEGIKRRLDEILVYLAERKTRNDPTSTE